MRAFSRKQILKRPNLLSQVSAFSTVSAFFVLILFLVIWIATPLKRLPGPTVTLPRFIYKVSPHQTAWAQPKKNADLHIVVLTLTLTRGMFLDEKPVTIERLMQELSALRESPEKVAVLLKVDRALPYARVSLVSAVLKYYGMNTAFLVVRAEGRPYEQVVAVRFPDLQKELPPIVAMH